MYNKYHGNGILISPKRFILIMFVLFLFSGLLVTNWAGRGRQQDSPSPTESVERPTDGGEGGKRDHRPPHSTGWRPEVINTVSNYYY